MNEEECEVYLIMADMMNIVEKLRKKGFDEKRIANIIFRAAFGISYFYHYIEEKESIS